VSLLYLRTRQLSPRVRAFLDWAAGEFAARNTPTSAPPSSPRRASESRS
jgi:hypothetical protein